MATLIKNSVADRFKGNSKTDSSPVTMDTIELCAAVSTKSNCKRAGIADTILKLLSVVIVLLPVYVTAQAVDGLQNTDVIAETSSKKTDGRQTPDTARYLTEYAVYTVAQTTANTQPEKSWLAQQTSAIAGMNVTGATVASANMAKIPYRLDLDTVKAWIESTAYTVAQKTANTEADVKAWLSQQIDSIADTDSTGVKASNLVINTFTPATAGTFDTLDGKDGSFTFTVSLSSDSSSFVQANGTGIIIASRAYTVSIIQPNNGRLSVDKLAALQDDTLTLTVVPYTGYKLIELDAYKTVDSTFLTLLYFSDTVRMFVMPDGDITVKALFASDNTNVSKITVTGAAQLETDPNYFTADCGATSVEISIETEDPKSQVFYNSVEGNTFMLDIRSADQYIVEYTVRSSSGIRKNHTLVVESRFLFDSIVGQMFDNILYVNNNPFTNGGYSFKTFNWYKKGQLIGSGQYYSAGSSRIDLLSDEAEYSVNLTTVGGKTINSCPGKITLHSSSLKAYPNPVRNGGILRLQSPAPKGSVVKIYDMHGSLVSTQTFAGDNSEISLPHVSGMYLISLNNQTVKVIVE